MKFHLTLLRSLLMKKKKKKRSVSFFGSFLLFREVIAVCSLFSLFNAVNEISCYANCMTHAFCHSYFFTISELLHI